MHRNQQRKEQQLDRIRHLHKLQNNDNITTTTTPVNQLLPQITGNASSSPPIHSSLQQTAKKSLISGTNRVTKTHNNIRSNSDAFIVSKTNLNSRSSTSKSLANCRTNSPLSSTPIAAQMTPLMKSSLQTTTTHWRSRQSPNSRLNISLPQQRRQINYQNYTPSIDEGSGDNRLKHLSLADNNNSEIKSLSTHEPNLSPEILFLIKEQAKALAKINSLQKKVEQLELSLNSRPQCSAKELTHDALCASSSATTKLVNSVKDRIIVSDDSGGEYSRATTTVSDEDELSSLLDQIARYSQQLHINHQRNKCNSNYNSQPNISSNSSSNQLPESMQTQLYKQKLLCFQPMPTRMSLSCEIPLDTQKQYNSHQSLSALLFEPNVETVLKNIDDMIDNETKANSSQLMAAYSSPHSSSSIYDGNAITATGVGVGVTATNASISATNSSTNWQLERVKSIIKQRKHEEYESQMRLADQWLKTHLRSETSDQQRFNNYMDSLEPFNFR